MIDRIKEKCKDRKMSISQIEQICGFGNGTIRRWENNLPSVDKVLKVANLLNTSIEWIITGKEDAELTPDENRLIECYRASDPAGKDAILGQAEYQANKALPEGVSVSKPGRTGTDN